MPKALLVLLAVLSPIVALAQQPVVEPLIPQVVSVSNLSKGSGDTRKNELNDVLKVKVRNLTAWQQIPANTSVPLHLFLAGTELRNVGVSPTGNDGGDAADISSLKATLEVDDKDPATRKAWVQVLRSAMLQDKTVPLSIGPQGAAPFPSQAVLTLTVFPSYTPGVLAFLGALVIGIVVLAKRSNLLRDSNGSPDPPYSLAKHQMAVWFTVIVGSYLYVWLITGTFSSISSTALILIGISGATGLAAVTLDNSKRDDAAKTQTTLAAEHEALDKTLNDPATGLDAQLRIAPPGSMEAAQITALARVAFARLQEVRATLGRSKLAPASNRRWYLDLLSDDTGISFHRLQMAVWTLVLVMVFIRAVWTDVMMPDFDATLLGIMGISSGTYLGFKLPEQKS